MAERNQRGWLKKESRAHGEPWVLFFRTLRKSDGKRVENKVPIVWLNTSRRRAKHGPKSKDCISASTKWIRGEGQHLAT